MSKAINPAEVAKHKEEKSGTRSWPTPNALLTFGVNLPAWIIVEDGVYVSRHFTLLG